MENIFLYAKYLAHIRNSKSIGIEDLRHTFSVFKWQIKEDADLEKLLEKNLNMTLNEGGDFLKEDYFIKGILSKLETAKELEKIAFSPTVKKIITELMKNGYTIHEERITMKQGVKGNITLENIVNNNDFFVDFIYDMRSSN